MIALPPDDRFYRDGPERPATPEQALAERAYREAFVAAAREASQWAAPDLDAVRAAWHDRYRNAERSRVRVRPGQHAFAAGHEVEAARARGRVQALEAVCESWQDLLRDQVPPEVVRAFVVGPWANAVDAWAQQQIDPARVRIPPFPTHLLTPDQRRALALVRPPAPAVPLLGQPRVVVPRFRSVRDLLLDHPRLRPPLIDGLLREGEILNVISSPKAGKSWLVTDLAIAVATGRPWLGLFGTHPGSVLVIDNELHGATTASRIPQVAQARGVPMEDFADAVFVENLRGNLVDVFELDRYFRDVEPGRFVLIVLDAMYRLLPKDMDENDNGGMARVYNQIDRYAQRLRSAFALVHHSTKGLQGDKSVTDVGAGAGSQSRAADTHLILRPHEQDGAVVLDAAVRSWPPVLPQCLRWSFPVFEPAPDLDPTALKRPASRRRSRSGTPQPAEPPEPPWTAERFTAELATDQPQTRDVLIQAGIDRGLSRRRATGLLRDAETAGLLFRWSEGANRPVRFATRPPPDDP